MPQSLDTMEVVEVFIPAKAQAHPIKQAKYTGNTGSEYSAKAGENMETYTCDAGCQNCHCATF